MNDTIDDESLGFIVKQCISKGNQRRKGNKGGKGGKRNTPRKQPNGRHPFSINPRPNSASNLNEMEHVVILEAAPSGMFPFRQTSPQPPHRGGSHQDSKAEIRIPPSSRVDPVHHQSYLENKLLLQPLFDKHVTSSEELNYVSALSTDNLNDLAKRVSDMCSIQENGASNSSTIPLRYRIIQSELPEDAKLKILQRLDTGRNSMGLNLNPVDVKYKQWVESVLQLPFGKQSGATATSDESPEPDPVQHMIEIAKSLETNIYGHDTTKQDLLRRVLSNGHPSPLLLWGPPGVGKTRMVRKTMALASGRPFVEIPLGGATNADFLRGSLYVYEGSGPGRISRALMTSGTMDPVIFLDELDKVSSTPQGQEIVSVLIQIVDGMQNDTFEDRYFADIPIDLSKCHFVFACNNFNNVDPVLRDRLDVVRVTGYSKNDKKQIITKHLVPDVCQEVGISTDKICLLESAQNELIDHTSEEGVRRVRELLRHTLQSVAAAIQIASSDHQVEARQVLGLDKSLVDTVQKSLRENKIVEIDRSMVISVLESRKGAETSSSGQNNTMYM